MSELKRYDLWASGHENACLVEEESAAGDWVRYEDIPKWQPIETAPRDGKVLVVEASGEVLLSRYGMGDWLIDCSDYYANPTHWMPLPEPPKEKE